MARSGIALGLLCVVSLAYAAKPIFDPHKCPNGCQTDDQCPQNAHCSLLNDGGTCGFCVCSEGFKAQGGKCGSEKGNTPKPSPTPRGGKKTTSGQSESTTQFTTESSTTSTTESTTTSTSTTTTSTVPTTTGTTTQGPPPAPTPLNCADFDCTAAPPGDASTQSPNCKKELVIPPRKCTMQGGGTCYGMYCLTVSPGNDYCICPPYKVDRQCAVDKTGQCSSATGQVPQGNTQLQGRRFRNPNNKDNGNIYGRHFAASLSDCVKLCQWSKDACRAVNFGQIGGANVCELLSSAATEKNLLSAWLEKADGWQYAQVGPAN